MFYLAVQIWFWVVLSAAVGLVVGIRLQRPTSVSTAVPTRTGETDRSDEVEKLLRDLKAAHTDAEAARNEVMALTLQVQELQDVAASSSEGVVSGVTDEEVQALETRLAEAEASAAETDTLRVRVTELETALAEAEAASRTSEDSSVLRDQIATLEQDLETALAPTGTVDEDDEIEYEDDDDADVLGYDGQEEDDAVTLEYEEDEEEPTETVAETDESVDWEADDETDEVVAASDAVAETDETDETDDVDDAVATSDTDDEVDTDAVAEADETTETTESTETVDADQDEEPTTAVDGGALPPYGLDEPVAGQPDELRRISGIGAKMEEKLYALGVYHLSQIASWTEDDIAHIDQELTTRGRIVRDNWVGQAQVRLEEAA